MSITVGGLESSNKKIIGKIYGKHSNPIYIEDNEFDFSHGDSKTNGAKKIKVQSESSNIFPEIANFKDGQNDRIFVTGKSGCGKSYGFIRPYIRAFKHKYGKKAIVYLFSSKPSDIALDDLDIKRINVNEDILLNPPNIKDFCNKDKKLPNLIVFDDIQDYKSKKINEAVARFRDEVMRNGRSLGLFSVFVNHVPTDYRQTKDQLFESTACVIFPKTSGHSDYDYMMQKYLGIKDANSMHLIKKAPSKFVYVSKKSPSFAMSDNYVIML